jgi:methionyl-tRNA formyltransferase
MGTPQIAVPSLQILKDNGFDIPLVLCQPDKPKGRGGKVQASPVKELALSLDLPIYQPAKLRNNQEAFEVLTACEPDFFAVVAYGKILPPAILSVPKYAPVNVHFSLLPKYRGAAPVNWAIRNGDSHTGVSTMLMDAGMDTGDILLVEKTPIAYKDAAELAEELSHTGAELLIKTLKFFPNIVPAPQNNANATTAPMMEKTTGKVDWSAAAADIERMIRAFVPWPCAYTYLDGKLLKIYGAEVDPGAKAEPGIVYNVSKSAINVGTGQGGLIIYELQLEGKKRMKAADFLAGYKLATGVRLG